MTADSYGDRRQPRFDATKPPDLGVDETLVSDYAATVGNRMVGTKAEMDALPQVWMWPGLEFYATDLQTIYVRGTGSWSVASYPSLIRSYVQGYAGTQAAGQTDLMVVTIPTKPYARRVIVQASGSTGHGSAAGYGGVYAIATSGTWRTSVAAGPGFGSFFTAGKYAAVSRQMVLDLAANQTSTITIRNDQDQPSTFFNLLVSATVIPDAEYV